MRGGEGRVLVETLSFQERLLLLLGNSVRSLRSLTVLLLDPSDGGGPPSLVKCLEVTVSLGLTLLTLFLPLYSLLVSVFR